MNLLRSIAALVALLLGACAHHAAADADRLTAALRSQPIVLLGEVHDNAAQHALRAQALRALVEGGARPALLMEQFDRERQAELDRALAKPGASADDVIAAAAPPDAGAMQGWAWPLYRPYIALALEYRLPIVAANVSRADTRRVVQSGLATLGFDAAVPADIEAAQASAIVEGHCGAIDAAQARRMVGAQIARDQFMARMVEAHAAQGAVLLAGNGHVRSDVGVPRWLSAATRERSVAIGLLEEGDASAAAYGIALFTPPQPRADPCAGMRASAPAAKL
jgi:uncharacterized iron-regulated protein